MEFASPTWSPWTEQDKALLEKVQKRAVNLVAGLQGNTYEDKCVELGLETLEKRRTKQDLLQTYKILHGVDKVDPRSLFTLTGPVIGRTTRFTADLMNIVEDRSRLDIKKILTRSESQANGTNWIRRLKKAAQHQPLNVF